MIFNINVTIYTIGLEVDYIRHGMLISKESEIDFCHSLSVLSRKYPIHAITADTEFEWHIDSTYFIESPSFNEIVLTVQNALRSICDSWVKIYFGTDCLAFKSIPSNIKIDGIDRISFSISDNHDEWDEESGLRKFPAAHVIADKLSCKLFLNLIRSRLCR